jgi:hypothetical protein
MNQYDISRTLSRKLEMNQYDIDYNQSFFSEEINFSLFVGYTDDGYSFQMTVGYF